MKKSKSPDLGNLQELWNKATKPDPKILVGKTYNVTILEGNYPNMKRLLHRKKFYLEDDTVKGYNQLMFGLIQFGHLVVVDGVNELTFSYNVKENPPYLRSLQDDIREISNGIYIGKIKTVSVREFMNSKIKETKERGWFLLIKKSNETPEERIH